MLSALLGLQSLLGAIRENYMAREIFEYWIMWWIFEPSNTYQWSGAGFDSIVGSFQSSVCLFHSHHFHWQFFGVLFLHLFFSIAHVSHSIIRYFPLRLLFFGTSVHRKSGNTDIRRCSQVSKLLPERVRRGRVVGLLREGVGRAGRGLPCRGCGSSVRPLSWNINKI